MKKKAIRREEMTFREKAHEVIFEADTFWGKTFDVVLLVLILINVIVVMLESVPGYNVQFATLFYWLELFFTVVFTAEYLMRIYTVNTPSKYITSMYGIIDLLSILPFYIALFLGAQSSLAIIRGLRLLRIFRIFKLGSFLSQGQIIVDSLKASFNKILVFLFFILIFVSIMGSIMYLIEGNINDGFDSIPRGIYWAIVTVTTVGYGDISPITPFGQFIAAMVMIAGYAVIAVPTGIVTSEVIKNADKYDDITTQACQNCAAEGHDSDAEYCKYCGNHLHA